MNSCSSTQQTDAATAKAAPSKDSLVKRGAYLVVAMGCNDCHSPKKMGPQGPYVDTTMALSGFHEGTPVPVASPDQLKYGQVVFAPDLTAAAGPWGTTFSANITSDPTGIGNWKEEQFVNAIKHGKYKGLDGGRMIMPPMPWEDFAHLGDEDIKDIFYYLKTTKPVKNVPPDFRPAGK
jgi:mono/diheme cytochrome c family protein